MIIRFFLGLLVLSLLLMGYGWADHEEVPHQCTGLLKELRKAQGQVDVPDIPDTLSLEEQREIIWKWKAKRKPIIDHAKGNLKRCTEKFAP